MTALLVRGKKSRILVSSFGFPLENGDNSASRSFYNSLRYVEEKCKQIIEIFYDTTICSLFDSTVYFPLSVNYA